MGELYGLEMKQIKDINLPVLYKFIILESWITKTC